MKDERQVAGELYNALVMLSKNRLGYCWCDRAVPDHTPECLVANDAANSYRKILGDEKKKNSQYRNEAIEVLDRLNSVTGKNFRPVDQNIKLIIARLKSGIEKGQLFAIITIKNRQCQDGSFDYKYMRPATLFNATKCEQYLGELGK